ncbi:acyltransferase family protein [Microvirga rosea]|uniref:acyltransferase family protein n=1 Tax=Microvirga rosea TaxID=2715425 RepID=UPI001D0B5912|nr:acyltransferase [Microvirga rosea]MCB8821627.1 acyltransferase [Microvirga rosea]
MSKLIHIQVLRALAALSVAFLHAQHDAAALAARTGQGFVSLDRLPWMAGVDVFFVISGFIMVYTSRPLFGHGGKARSFLLRRIIRIVPLYWAVTTFYLAIALAAPALLNSDPLASWQVLASYLFIPFERPDGTVQPLYSLGWTLNYEMFFYLLFAGVLALPWRRALSLLIVGFSLLAVTGRMFPLSQPFGFWTDPIVLEFAFGLGLGWLHAEGVSLSRPVRWLLVALALSVLAMNFIGLRSNLNEMRPFAWGLPAACLVAAAAMGKTRRAPGALTRFGEMTGDASYAIYLIHPFVIRGIGRVIAGAGAEAVLGPWGFIAIALAATLAAGLLIHAFLERPAIRLLRRWFEGSRSGEASA